MTALHPAVALPDNLSPPGLLLCAPVTAGSTPTATLQHITYPVPSLPVPSCPIPSQDGTGRDETGTGTAHSQRLSYSNGPPLPSRRLSDSLCVHSSCPVLVPSRPDVPSRRPVPTFRPDGRSTGLDGRDGRGKFIDEKGHLKKIN